MPSDGDCLSLEEEKKEDNEEQDDERKEEENEQPDINITPANQQRGDEEENKA